MLQNSEIRKIYSELQKQLFYLIPEKWDRIYLYASVEEKIDGLETGELFFYYFPKGILKKNPVNVYEIPNKFNLNEGEYIKLVEKLYNEIKKLRRAFKKYNKRLWSNVTIRIEGIRFEIEYNYERLSNSNYSNIDKHIIWKYYNLKLPEEAFTRSEQRIIRKYINETIYFNPDIEIYTESIYKNPVKKYLTIIEKIKKLNIYKKLGIQKSEKQAKSRFDEKRYSYKIQGTKKIRKLHEKEKNSRQKTYIEQIEEQRKAVRSQILKHM